MANFTGFHYDIGYYGTPFDKFLEVMTSHDPNPYAPPQTACTAAAVRTTYGSLTISGVSAICLVAFIVFTIVLLRSNGGDRKAGILFLANIPVLLGLVVSTARSTRIGVYFGIAVAAVQVAITILMLFMSIGDVSLVIGINAMIIVPPLVIAFRAWVTYQRRLSSEHAAPQTND
ncbi:hypothetical protein CA13_17770 [Planctomycetes bacterium CA13]|uniref:Uncharacterized protein n=1 Tax=Novipirellula herctigrandis TaxID=2527986 RepID=A0A5C5YZ98_9BACT|nr:hypothetical protein CA13_17770 [Planctomycetes bacterium CA13]